MSNKIENHPSLIYAAEIAEICKGLKHLNITYFAHTKVTAEGLSAITNNPGFCEHYFKNHYYNFDINQAKKGLIKKYFLWDSIERRGQTAKMHEEAGGFGVKHTFTILEKCGNERNYYHFANNANDNSINQVYLTNIDLLEFFIKHFKDKVNNSHLSKAYDVKFSIDNAESDYQVSCNPEMVDMDKQRKQLMNEMDVKEKFHIDATKTLSIRDIQILLWLHKGKTVEDIANILNLAYVTVNKRIQIIKAKLHCYNQFQLGEKFREVIADSNDLVKFIADKYID